MSQDFVVVLEYGLAIWGVLFLTFFTALAVEDLWSSRRGKGKHR